MLVSTAETLGAPQITKKLREGLASLQSGTLDPAARTALLTDLGTSVLNTAKRFGKARFAQVAARYADTCTELPPYIQAAIDWLDA